MNEVTTTGSLREVWVSSQQSSGASCAYNESFSIKLQGAVDGAILEKALLEVVERHDALTATFSSDGIIIKKRKLESSPVFRHDLRDKNEQECIVYKENLLKLEAETPFDLELGPLWRAHIVISSERAYELLFTAHHIVCDGWSIGILTREIGKVYTALSSGASPNIEIPVSFFDYLDRVGKQFDTDRKQQVIDFWKKKFTPPVPVLDLPVDHLRPKMRTYGARCKRKKIDNDTVALLKKAAAGEGCNPFSFLLAVYAILLYRLSGSKDIVVGVPVAGQSYSTNPLLVGHCVSMLPIRIAIDPDVLFGDFAASLQDALIESYDYHEVSFGDLIRELNLPRDPARIPLVPVGFTLAKLNDSEEMGFDGLEVTCRLNDRLFETFEVYATIIASKKGYELFWHFNSALFDDVTAERWLEEYEVLLLGVIDTPGVVIRKAPVLTVLEQEMVMNRWNATAMHFDHDVMVTDLFELQVKYSPQAVAIEYKETTITYQELNNRADAFAAYLVQQGTGPETAIACCLERSIDMVVCLLGILKSGASYIPIDPSFPDERITYILNDSGAMALIIGRDSGDRFLHSNVLVIPAENIPISTEQPVKKMANGNHCAYIIYTSGSTGKPKGVEIRHCSFTNFLLSMREVPGISSMDILLAITTISFDIAGLELFLPLVCGARVLLADKELAMDGIRLAEFISQKKPTLLQATPATWNMLFDAGWRDASGMKLLCGGEAMTRTLANRLLSTGAEVWNMYGPTETTVWSAVWKVMPGDESPPIGRPIANTQLHILNEDLQTVPTGAVGELCIGGVGLARGYRNRPELTTEKFVDNPVPVEELSAFEKRLYKTGDLARWRNDGIIEVLGRSDFQVKIRGFRIELGEIEAVLSKHSGISECVATVGEDAHSNKILIGYFVPHENIDVSISDLRAFLRRTLPEYMVPSQFILLPSLPRLLNNKIDRKSLPKPPSVGTGSSLESSQNGIFSSERSSWQPRTHQEQYLAKVWKNFLSIDTIHPDDNFFDLGGHSLLSMQIIVHIKKEIRHEIRPRDMILNTFEQLAQTIILPTQIPLKVSGKKKNILDKIVSYVHGCRPFEHPKPDKS